MDKLWPLGIFSHKVHFESDSLRCRTGWSLVLFYLGSLAYYLYVRITGLNLGLYNIYRSGDFLLVPLHSMAIFVLNSPDFKECSAPTQRYQQTVIPCQATKEVLLMLHLQYLLWQIIDGIGLVQHRNACSGVLRSVHSHALWPESLVGPPLQWVWGGPQTAWETKGQLHFEHLTSLILVSSTS